MFIKIFKIDRLVLHHSFITKKSVFFIFICYEGLKLYIKQLMLFNKIKNIFLYIIELNKFYIKA